MAFDLVQRFIYTFDQYSLFFVLTTHIYGLLVDIKLSKEKETNRDARLAKRMYISFITFSIMLYAIPRLIQ